MNALMGGGAGLKSRWEKFGGGVNPGIGAYAAGPPGQVALHQKRAEISDMPLGLPVQMKEDNSNNNCSEQHPNWPKQPQKQQDAEVITPHTHGVMHHAAVKNFSYIFGSYFVSQIERNVDHEVNVV
jgi:hypothetical protein